MRNSFLRVLRDRFEGIYRLAAEKGEESCLLVPCAECLPDENFNQVFIEAHVLRATRAPGFFMNLVGQGVEIKDNAVSTHLGFQENRVCAVLQTESMYDYSHTFRVLVVDRPLTGKFRPTPGSERVPTGTTAGSGSRPAAPMVDQACEWLNTAPAIQDDLFDQVDRFRKTFVQVPGCEQSTAERIRELVENATARLITHHNLKQPSQHRQLDYHVSRSVYAALHSFVFPHLKDILVEPEERLEAAILSYGSTAELLNCIPKAQENGLGSVDIQACSDQLDLLDHRITPHEKIQCIDEAHSVLQRCVQEAPRVGEGAVEITGDDVLSLFILAVHGARGWKHRLAHAAHIEMYLQGDEAARLEEAGYAATVLQGALQFFLDERKGSSTPSRSSGPGGSGVGTFGSSRSEGRSGTIISGLVGGGAEQDAELDRAGMQLQGLVRQARAQSSAEGQQGMPRR